LTVTEKGCSRWPLHSHKEWEIVYYTRGTGVLRTDKGSIPFRPGCIIVIPPKYRHGSEADDTFENICIHSQWDGVFPRDKILISRDTENKDGEQMARLTARLYFEKNEISRKLLNSLLNTYKEYILLRTSSPSGYPPHIEAVKTEMLERFTDSKFNLSETIAETGYSDDHFRICFKKLLGVTPAQYLTQLRLSYADSLIENYSERVPVNEVACLSGFSDPLYFSRLYKKVKGIPPKDAVSKNGMK
jgi:AraC-like DNA-binding protein